MIKPGPIDEITLSDMLQAVGEDLERIHQYIRTDGGRKGNAGLTADQAREDTASAVVCRETEMILDRVKIAATKGKEFIQVNDFGFHQKGEAIPASDHQKVIVRELKRRGFSVNHACLIGGERCLLVSWGG